MKLLAALLLIAGGLMADASITIEKAEVSFPAPDTVRLEVAAVGKGVQVGSYGVRTMSKDSPLPAGFIARPAYGFLAAAPRKDEPLWYLFLDNKRGDEDPAEGAVAIDMKVAEWESGEHRLMVFACNRPHAGSYAQDSRPVRVVVKGGLVVQDETRFLDRMSLRIATLKVEPERVQSGQPVVIRAGLESANIDGTRLQITVPYTVGPDEAPLGFHYVPDKKMAYLVAKEPHFLADNGPLDEDPARDAFAVRVATDGWKPGVHNLTAVASATEAFGGVTDFRDLAVTVLPETPQFAATLEDDQFLRTGTHFECLCRLPDGSVLAGNQITRDGGRTWEPIPGSPGIPMAHALSDGAIIGMKVRTQPIEGRPGYYSVPLYISRDGGKTVQGPIQAEVHVPKATKGIGHAAAEGPIFWRSIVPLPDGSLLAAMYGWFEGDESPVPGQPGSFRYRTFVVRSEDQGKSWEYVSTVAYDPQIGTEGYCEPVIRRLPNGELLALLRTGGNNRRFYQDNPLCVSRSTDDGKAWSEPVRSGFEGVSPDLVVMSDGTLACSTGRPGAWVLLSTDNGHTWGDAISINAERYSGYTALTEVEPGVLLVGYGAMNRPDPETGERSNELRTVRVRLTRLNEAGQ